MIDAQALRRIASRTAANLVAVAAISAIFGLKTYMTAHGIEPANAANTQLATHTTAVYEPVVADSN